jgi:hypothetical protein
MLSKTPAPLATLLFATLGLTSLYACSASKTHQTFEGSGGSGGTSSSTSTSTSSSNSTSGTGGTLFDGGSSGAGGGIDSCTDEAKLIYAIDQGNSLYSFNPTTVTLKQIGVINCPQNGGFATPFSMAVDRSATAWVLFSDGNIYNVDTKTATCKATAFVPNQNPNFTTFGMGFVSDAPGSMTETLYVGAYAGTGIAKIDTQTLKLTPIGSYDIVSGPAEITGTGDARLFGFFYQQQNPGAPPIIAELDKTNSHTLSQATQNGITIGSGWAFAFWGGDFYLFTAPTGKSRIDKYSPATKTNTLVLPVAGANVIVGAGVSTCAPVEPPK